MLLFEIVAWVRTWCGVRPGNVVGIRKPGNRGCTSRERSIRTAARTITVRVTIVHRLAIATCGIERYIITRGGRGSNIHRRGAVIVRVGRLVGRASDIHVTPVVFNSNCKGTLASAGFGRWVDHGGSYREERS